MRFLEDMVVAGGRLKRWTGLLAPLRVPGLPSVPRISALLVLRYPRLVPVRLRWRATSDGLGLVVARLMESPASSAGAVLEDIGRAQGAALREQLGYGRNALECARAVALANRLVRIAASAEPESQGDGTRAFVRTPGCPWSRHEWWSAAPCGAFSRYERGLAKGLNPAVGIRYVSKRTRGDDACVGVYSIENGDAG